jgi:hypothetical protein
MEVGKGQNWGCSPKEKENLANYLNIKRSRILVSAMLNHSKGTISYLIHTF